MDFDKAIAIWRSSKYKKINQYLVKKVTGKTPRYYISALRKMNNDPEDIQSVITTIKKNMKPIDYERKYYRGDSISKATNCHVETFMSITTNKEDAEAFVNKNDGGVLYEIHIEDGVKGVKTGSEGEILLEDGCFWEYSNKNGKKIATIHPPDADKRYPFCSIVTSGGGRRTRKRRRGSK